MTEIFTLVDNPAQAAAEAEALFESVRTALQARLPAGAIIEHIGATAIAGCETKGDLDLVIRVPPETFRQCCTILSGLYAGNEGSIRTDTFAAFVAEGEALPVGVQLVAIGSELDDFCAFRDRLAANPALVEAYNALKRRFHGSPHDDYRAAKAAFIATVLQGPR